jgi:hypothetical protein
MCSLVLPKSKFNPHALWQASQDLQNSLASLNNISHHYLASNIFLVVMSAANVFTVLS